MLPMGWGLHICSYFNHGPTTGLRDGNALEIVESVSLHVDVVRDLEELVCVQAGSCWQHRELLRIWKRAL